MKRVRVVTLAFALAILVAAFTAQPVSAASRYDSLRSYMNERWDPVRGGYSLPDTIVRVDQTYGAIAIFDTLGILSNRPPPVDIPKVMEFTTGLQRLLGKDDEPDYGGFMEYLAGPVTSERTHWGVELWQTLKGQTGIPGTDQYAINETAILVYVNKTQTESGGFSSGPGLYPDIVSTYHALATMQILDSLYGEDLDAWSWLANSTTTLEFIESCRYGNGFMLSPISDREGVTPTAAGLLALDILGELPTFPGLDDMKQWILGRQITHASDSDFVGGFEESEQTEDPNLQSTYWAMKVLHLLQGIDELNQTIARDFILRCQSTDGAWARIPGLGAGNLVFASYAAQCLDYIGNALSILSSSAYPGSAAGFAVDWRVLAIVGIIVVALLLAVLSIRMD